MKGIGLAPSPNWYCSKVSDCTAEGIFGFGIKQNVALLNIAANPPVYCGLLNGKSLNDRIVGIRFASTQTELVSAAETGVVTIWNVTSHVELKHFHEHQAKVTCVDWSTIDYDLIASGDEKGVVCVYSNGTTKKNQLHKTGQISTIVFSPYDKNFAAVGFRDGLILIVDVQNNCSSVHLLRRHDDEIQSLCWLTSVESKEILLASGSKDATVRRWNASEGKLISTSKIPQYSSGYRSRHQDEPFKSRLWVTLYWSHQWESTLFCSGYHGELLALNSSKDVKHQWEVIFSKDSPAHNRSIFNISGFQTKACTISMDRQIILWNLELRTSVNSIATLGGFVYGLHFSPVDIGRLAVGVGDNIIRVWNTQPSAGSYNVTCYWQGLRSKVTTIAWHPKLEGRLAFGTEEGRVGIYNLLSNKSPNISNDNHQGIVYTVVWGVSCTDNSNSDSKQKLIVYSCGKGRIFAHPHSLQGDSQDLNDIILKQNPYPKRFSQRSEISWNDELTLMAIGNEDGSIEVYTTPNLKRIVTILEIRLLIQCLRWHPKSTAEAIESRYRYWLAASSNGSSICVYDLEPYIKAQSSENYDPIPPKNIRKLDGHKLRVASLNWSPHVCGYLASVSYDGTAQVWDVIQGKPIANFRGHNGRIFAVEWNPFDPDVIYTGGEDTTVQRWMISEQEHTMPPDLTKAKKSKKKKATEEAKSVIPEDVAAEIEQLLRSKKEELMRAKMGTQVKEITSVNENGVNPVEQSAHEEFSTETNKKIEDDITNSEKSFSVTTEPPNSRKEFFTKKKKKKPFKSLFPVSAQLDNRGKASSLSDLQLLVERCSNITNRRTNNDEDGINETLKNGSEMLSTEEKDIKFGCGDNAHLGWFTNRVDAFRLLKTESNYHIEHDNLDYALQLEVWKGNIGNAINLAASHNQLSDWLVSLAPLGSRILWKKACSMYSNQLMQEGQVYRAVLYLLAICDVEGAVELFRSKKMFREALSLAKVRLASDNPVINELLAEWANQSVKEGNYEQAAKCGVAMGHLSEAGRTLSLRSDPSSLKVAAHLANAGGDAAEALRFAEQCIVDFLLKNNWATVTEVIETYPTLMVFSYIVEVHKLLHCELEILAAENEKWKLHPITNSSSLLIWKASEMEERSILHQILNKWRANELNLEDKNAIEEVIAFLEDKVQGNTALLSYSQLLLRLSYLLTSAVLNSIISEIETAMQKMIEALTLSYQAGSLQTFQALCRLLLVDGTTDVKNILPCEYDSNSYRDIFMQSIFAYYAMAVLKFLTNEATKEKCDPFGSEITISENLDFIDELDEKAKNKKSEEKTYSDLNKLDVIANEALIEQLILRLLIDSRAAVCVLENELIYVQKAIVNLTAKMKSQGPVIKETSEETNLHFPLLSKSASTASDMTDKTLDYLDTLDISCEEGTLSTSQSDIDVILELDYNLPCDERYNIIGLDLTVLRAEKDRIERALKATHELKAISFPDPIENALLILEHCKRFSLVDLQRRVVNWTKKFAPLKEQRQKLTSYE